MFKNVTFRRVGLLGVLGLIPWTTASGQIISDGDFESLSIGTNPDCDTPAGAWGWPANYVSSGLCEVLPEEFSIVEVTAFDPNGQGNALHYNVDDPNTNIHLTNIFNETLFEDPNIVIVVQFDIFVPGPAAGGSFYIGGDHGGGGFSNASDRGPQMTWNPDGTITARVGGVNVTLVAAYPTGVWQTIRVDIDLAADTFDAYWGLTGEPLNLVGSSVGYRSGLLDHIDRFTAAHFGGLHGTEESLIDNVSVETDGCVADCNGDGTVNTLDFLCYLNLYSAGDPEADCNGDGQVNTLDFLCFLNAFNAGC